MSTSKLFSGVKSRAFFVCVLFLSMAGISRAQSNIQEFTILLGDPTLDFYIEPEHIAYGPDGAYWFTEFGLNKIGRIETVSNTFSHVQITNVNHTSPFGLVRGQGSDSDYLWFTESGVDKIGHLNALTSNFVEYALPEPGVRPWTIINGPDGNIWFSEFASNRVAAIPIAPATNANGKLVLVHESATIKSNSQIYGLTAGPDGNVWFADATWGIIYRLTTDSFAGTLTAFPLPNTNCQPVSMVVGPDNALWFTEYNGTNIGRITTDGQKSEFSLSTVNHTNPRPYGLTVGPDNNLWFTLYTGSAVGRMATNGVFTIFPTPTSGSHPTFIATGDAPPFADSNIWFCEFVSGTVGLDYQKIGKVTVNEALNLDASTNIFFTSGTTFSGLLAAFQNSNATNTVTVNWGDRTGSTLKITNIAANASVTTNTVLVTNSMTVTNSLTITNIVGITTNANGDYQILVSHTYSTAVSNYPITLTVIDGSNDIATAHITLATDPFFNGQIPLASQVDYLQFPNGTLFGYYTLAYFPYLYHFDMGFEYFIDGNDGVGGVYLYDFSSGDWFYTSPTLFPYLYDFTLGAWLYYYPDTSNPGHYTTNPRYFYNFGASTIITR